MKCRQTRTRNLMSFRGGWRCRRENRSDEKKRGEKRSSPLMARQRAVLVHKIESRNGDSAISSLVYRYRSPPPPPPPRSDPFLTSVKNTRAIQRSRQYNIFKFSNRCPFCRNNCNIENTALYCTGRIEWNLQTGSFNISNERS